MIILKNKMAYTNRDVLKPLVCANCGQEFIFSGMLKDYVYTRKERIPKTNTNCKLYFCSWTCMREYDNKRLDKD